MLIFIGMIGGTIFIYFSPAFEREAPIAGFENNGYWNLKTPLEISLRDESGIRSYKVTLQANNETIVLANEQIETPKAEMLISVEAPKRVAAFNPENATLSIEANDGSRWNFFSGNHVEQSYPLIIDMKAPRVSTVAHSMYMHKGGSGLVVFAADDPNLSEVYIDTNYGKRFIPQPFYKDGYYISLLAWQVTEPSFRAQLVAVDRAGNTYKSTIPFRLQDRKYQVSKIKLSDSFLNGKIAELADTFEISQQTEDRLEQFKLINEDIRAKNENKIHTLTSVVSDEKVDALSIKPFYPLKNGQKVASFGDHRLYYYKGNKVSESYHLGIDLASVKMGAIMTQNAGKVVASEFNGIYGLMPAIDHGLGLYTIYGHCSASSVQSGDEVHSGEQIANTGMSGYAMGDHLHFGVLVQGIEVRPEEWMDTKWLRLNIYDTIKDAKKIIDRQ